MFETRKTRYERLKRERAAVTAARKLRNRQASALVALGCKAAVPPPGLRSTYLHKR